MIFLKGRIYHMASGANFEYWGKSAGRFDMGKLTFRSIETNQFVNFNADGTHPHDTTLNLIGENQKLKRGYER